MDLDITKSLADLSCDTADELEERSCDYVRVLLSVDDIALEEYRVEPARSEFEYEHFIFSVSQVRKDGAHLVNLSCLTSPDYEWFLNTQMRIRTGPSDAVVLKVVDKVSRIVIKLVNAYFSIIITVIYGEPHLARKIGGIKHIQLTSLKNYSQQEVETQ
ncbi:hypothetical protein OESDEN_12016 [Oesophagostomum dentatum]|uniref:Uncharacterized protein n=1 Tax=Oesophagostomum dentatum TaxID=61180 RepID=A0A0B1STD4_OESDE|nr:hypothetical protein OESDEN_12016 [Oesophagostomum dentatum]